MTGQFKAEDLAAVRREGSLTDLFAHLTGKPLPEPEPEVQDEPLGYHIARPGAWPCGTAASGPTPAPVCTNCVEVGDA
ncbi:hypothetical protein ACFVT5_40975 [Streptomyces sp. NPDC058001]|uniref:hypothetical protein n=1 Tax=Streptomyces sp. NPDC058001 TaxID=3346300 RepID=UPI0036E45444